MKKPLDAKALLAMPPGSMLKDATNDVWEKTKDGVWVCLDATMMGEALLHAWGPVTEVRYA